MIEEIIKTILAVIGGVYILLKAGILLGRIICWFEEIENPADKLKIVLLIIGTIGIGILNALLYHF